MPTDPTGAARQQRFRDGQAQPRLQCSSCPRWHLGAHGDLCWRCWRLTPAGKRDTADRVAQSRARKSNVKKSERSPDQPPTA